MEWLVVWLAFGMLAAHEIGGLATAPGSAPALALSYAVAAVFGLAMMVRRSVRKRHPALLYPSLVLSLGGLGIVALLLYQRKAAPDWISALVAGASFFALSACAGLAGVLIAWRRREADRERRSRHAQDWERRRLLEQSAGGPTQEIIAELENPPVEDDADLLPPRPPKH